MRRKLVVTLAMCLLGATLWLSGCDRWVAVDAGLYVPQRPDVPLEASETGTPYVKDTELDGILIDRDHQVVWVFFEDTTLRIIPFTPRPRAAWPSGCPTNIQATRMEALDLPMDALALSGDDNVITVDHPVIVRDCPADPIQLVLRDDGDIGGGVACAGAQTCVELAPTSRSFSLPHAMKGYEVYNWFVEDAGVWRYTLITGTNRTKTWEEIMTPESTITADGWVKITVEGDAALQSVLDHIPEGDPVIRIEM
jgi:hypothetical protein